MQQILALKPEEPDLTLNEIEPPTDLQSAPRLGGWPPMRLHPGAEKTGQIVCYLTMRQRLPIDGTVRILLKFAARGSLQSKLGAVPDPGCKPLDSGGAGFGGPQLGLKRFFEQAFIGSCSCSGASTPDAKTLPQLVGAPQRALPGLFIRTRIDEPSAMPAQKTTTPRLLPREIQFDHAPATPGSSNPWADEIGTAAAEPARHTDEWDDFTAPTVTAPTVIAAGERAAPGQVQPPHFGTQVEGDDPAIAEDQWAGTELTGLQAAARRQMIGVELPARVHEFPRTGTLPA